ncbi:ferritin-like domain-containing protein [Halomonas sp. McH1-25]|uniref:ferritin-like domain-containing protein n=1 Tax=unclassified Halomonas TaxID=2609666 RepID=UPI001EF5D357|nr:MULTISPECIES: ferritin-like domain-containing protein [unclassified Halomonas]MCG7598350.1 ferritin-like domain-containing protein [Halomonas sp. McH1-25]MCP1342708.1 ferritin-like domain-containing protein [Halomonas sp. FL8]MCP1362179.1 ferritin-like domain-containing protein [Halomonas sp. BBD45]MCP1364220.1 ferritin-like domain-containing protein [Halomonas sp. BBD48]
MKAAEKRLVEWLRDAHAMEEQAEQMLKAQAGRIENYPEIKQRIEQHIEETVNQGKQLEACLARYDESPSTVKDTTGKMTAMGQAAGGMFSGDEIVKGCIASYTFEHMEIASYRVLISTAEEAGDAETKRICEGILREEEAMAAWLEQHTPQAVHQYLQRDEAPGADAKR